MRVLISAYACEPGVGSEPGVGFEVVSSVAEEHDVWLLTRSNNVGAIEHELSRRKQATVRVIGIDLGSRALRVKALTKRIGLQAYYHLWQRHAATVAAELDDQVDFDVVHHATFAAYWMKIGVGVLRKPLVVGPVGGGAVTPVGMLAVVGIRGLPGEIARRSLRPLASRLTGASSVLKRAGVVLVQNPDVSRRVGSPRVIELPNGLVGAFGVGLASQPSGVAGPAIFSGRLVGWKGATLAVSAWRHIPQDGPPLHLFGDGPERRRLERLIRRWSLADRVRLMGQVRRPDMVDALGAARVLVHPAVHDDSPLAVAEALAAGVPVVALDLAGPPVIARYWPDGHTRLISPSNPVRVARDIAAAVMSVADRRQAPDRSPALEFKRGVLRAYEAAIAG